MHSWGWRWVCCTLLVGCAGSSGTALDDSTGRERTETPGPSSVTEGAPIIDAVHLPATPTLTADGYWTVQGTIDYHDLDDGVGTIRIAYESSPVGPLEYDYPAVQSKRGVGVPIIVKFDVRTAPGEQSIAIVLIDFAGHSTSSPQRVVLPRP